MFVIYFFIKKMFVLFEENIRIKVHNKYFVYERINKTEFFELNTKNIEMTHMPLMVYLNQNERGHYIEYVDIYNHPGRWYLFFKQQIYTPPLQKSGYFKKNENCRVKNLNIAII